MAEAVETIRSAELDEACEILGQFLPWDGLAALQSRIRGGDVRSLELTSDTHGPSYLYVNGMEIWRDEWDLDSVPITIVNDAEIIEDIISEHIAND